MSEELKLTAKQFKEMTSQIIETINRTIDAKDPYTKGHSKRVAHYSGLIGERLGLSDEELMFLRYAALLHDIGKIGIPDAILQKPEQLTPQEYEQIKQFYGKPIDPNLNVELNHYILEGGFPRTVQIDDLAAKRTYVTGVINEIFEKDIRRRVKIKTKQLLKWLEIL